MYKCQKCKKSSSPGEKRNIKITQTRLKEYYEMENATGDDGNPSKIRGRLQGTGVETVKEIQICSNCYS